jgi:hypothetical protein
MFFSFLPVTLHAVAVSLCRQNCPVLREQNVTRPIIVVSLACYYVLSLASKYPLPCLYVYRTTCSVSNDCKEDQKEDGRITLTWILCRWAGKKWRRFVPSVGCDISDFEASCCGAELRERVFVSLQKMKFGVYVTVTPACPLQYRYCLLQRS